MNVLLIFTGILFFICITVGAVRGFVKIIVSLAATIAVIAFSVYFTPYVSEGIRKVVPVESLVQRQVIERVTEKIEIPDVEISRDQQIKVVEQADMPVFFRRLLLENNNSEIYKTLGAATFGEYVGKYLAKMVSDSIAFLVVLLIAEIAVHSVIHALGWIENLPVVGGLNRIAGGILGMGTGIVIIWTFFIVIMLLYNTDMAKICFQNIRDSRLLTFLYENNILMNEIIRFR